MNKRKYWYKTEIVECVLCGHEQKIKYRMYTKKPKDFSKRVIYIQSACIHHF
jgi:Zn ribbon nucleic-acid-binding protein